MKVMQHVERYIVWMVSDIEIINNSHSDTHLLPSGGLFGGASSTIDEGVTKYKT